MLYLGFLALLVVAFRTWKRLGVLEARLFDLTSRIGALERRPHPVAPPAAATPTAAAAGPAPPATSRPPRLSEPAPSFSPAIPPSVVPPISTREPAIAAPPASRQSLEARIGSQWLLYIGVIAVVVGVGYFEKLAIDNHWISETMRVMQGAIVGVLLIAAGLHFVKRGYALYGQIVAGGGIAVLYISTYAAFNFYHVIPWPAAFAVMCAITAAAAWLADRLPSQGLALMAAGGGFATPFLLATGSDAHVALFGYDAVLLAGTMYLATRREWPGLILAGYLFTLLTVAAWAATFYEPSKYLSTELFITLFCGMSLVLLRRGGRPPARFARLVYDVLWSAPVFYYLASLAILSSHPIAFLIFIIALALAGAIVKARTDSSVWALTFLIAVQAPLLVWIEAHAGRTWLVAGLAVVLAVYAMNLLSQLRDARQQQTAPLGEIAIWWLHMSGLAAFGGAYLLVEAVRAGLTGTVAFAFALLQAGCALWLKTRNRAAAIHFVALAATLVAVGAALEFDGAWVTVAWASEGAAIVWLALREDRTWLRAGGVLLFLVAIGRLLGLLATDPRVDQVPVLNRRTAAAAFVIALTLLITWLHQRRLPVTRAVHVAIGLVTAALLVLAASASEIVAFHAIRGPAPFEPAAQLLMAASIVGGAIIGLGVTRREEWAHLIGTVMVGMSALALLEMQGADAPAAYQVAANGRVWAGAVLVAVLYAVAAISYRAGAHRTDRAARLAIALLAASVFTLTTLSSEITAYWHVRDAVRDVPAADVVRHHFARQLTLSMTWAVYATALIVAGFRKRYAPIRYFAIALFAVTIAKVTLVDLAELERIYRVASIVALGVTLLVTSYLYTRFKSTLDDLA